MQPTSQHTLRRLNKPNLAACRVLGLLYHMSYSISAYRKEPYGILFGKYLGFHILPALPARGRSILPDGPEGSASSTDLVHARQLLLNLT